MKRLVVAIAAFGMLVSTASADQREWSLEAAVGPALQHMALDYGTRSYAAQKLAYGSAGGSLRYGVKDYGVKSTLELGGMALYAANEDVAFSGVRINDRVTGKALVTYTSLLAGPELRFKYGSTYIGYATLGAGFHRLAMFDRSILTTDGRLVERVPSEVQNSAYGAVGLGFEWRFWNYGSLSLEGQFVKDIPGKSFTIPAALKATTYWSL